MPLVAKVWERLNLMAILRYEPQCRHVKDACRDGSGGGGRIGDGIPDHVGGDWVKADDKPGGAGGRTKRIERADNDVVNSSPGQSHGSIGRSGRIVGRHG